MFEDLVNKFVIIEFSLRGQPARTIAYVTEVKEGFIALESPAKRSKYTVATSSIINITELPPEKVRPEYRR